MSDTWLMVTGVGRFWLPAMTLWRENTVLKFTASSCSDGVFTMI